MKDSKRPLALLGPQTGGADGDNPSLRSFLQTLSGAPAGAPTGTTTGGRVALVAAGWEEREAETGDLEEHLEHPVTNLGLWPLCEDAFAEDSALQTMMFERFDTMREYARLYRMRLAPELDALRAMSAEVRESDASAELVEPALAEGFAALRRLDESHVKRVSALNDEVFARVQERDAVKRGREAVAGTLDGAETLLVAGGHVGILYNRMRMFGVLDSLPDSAAVIGWSAGAMVLTERILLFHDSPPQGSGDPELYGPGFGLARGIVVLPHANSRLDLSDRARVSMLARRFEDATVLALDAGEGVIDGDKPGEWAIDDSHRRLMSAGEVLGAQMDTSEGLVTP